MSSVVVVIAASSPVVFTGAVTAAALESGLFSAVGPLDVPGGSGSVVMAGLGRGSIPLSLACFAAGLAPERLGVVVLRVEHLIPLSERERFAAILTVDDLVRHDYGPLANPRASSYARG